MDNITYSARRLRVDKLSEERPGSDFQVQELVVEASTSEVKDSELKFERAAFVVPEATLGVQVTWK